MAKKRNASSALVCEKMVRGSGVTSPDKMPSSISLCSATICTAILCCSAELLQLRGVVVSTKGL